MTIASSSWLRPRRRRLPISSSAASRKALLQIELQAQLAQDLPSDDRARGIYERLCQFLAHFDFVVQRPDHLAPHVASDQFVVSGGRMPERSPPEAVDRHGKSEVFAKA